LFGPANEVNSLRELVHLEDVDDLAEKEGGLRLLIVRVLEASLPPIRLLDMYCSRGQYAIGVDICVKDGGEVLFTAIAELSAQDTYELIDIPIDVSFTGIAEAPVVKVWLLRKSDQAKLILFDAADPCANVECEFGQVGSENEIYAYEGASFQIAGLPAMGFETMVDFVAADMPFVEKTRMSKTYKELKKPAVKELKMESVRISLDDPGHGGGLADVDADLLLQLLSSPAVAEAWTRPQTTTTVYSSTKEGHTGTLSQKHKPSKDDAHLVLKLVEKAGLIPRILQSLAPKQVGSAGRVSRAWHAASGCDEAWALICGACFTKVQALPCCTVTLRQLYIQQLGAASKVVTSVLPTPENLLSSYMVAIEVFVDGNAYDLDNQLHRRSARPVFTALEELSPDQEEPVQNAADHLYQRKFEEGNSLAIRKQDIDAVHMSAFLIRKSDGKMLCLFERKPMRDNDDYGWGRQLCSAPSCGNRFPQAYFDADLTTVNFSCSGYERDGYYSIASLSLKLQTEDESYELDEVESLAGLLCIVGCPAFEFLWA
jgi:hypothetical protein